LCRLFGISRQAHYQHFKTNLKDHLSQELVVQEVQNIRSKHPRIGGRKLHRLLSDFMPKHDIKMGRDALFDLLFVHNLLVKRRKKRVVTTNSYHRYHKYPNCIKTLVPTKSNQLWVCDITYWKIDTGFVYLSLITDAYSHKVVGYNLAETLHAIESINALQMAIMNAGCDLTGLIHHSDRGVQYCCDAYVKLLEDQKIIISMTENGDPLENAVAERINGILKGEYLETYQAPNLVKAIELLDSVIKLYNEERPHMSISNQTPIKVHDSKENIPVKRLWKNYNALKFRKEVKLD
jgi:putative transposase